MWVYDGEEWREEGSTPAETTHQPMPQRRDELVPELQIVEHVPATSTRTNRMPPLPLP
ncbi:MAG TPA: hypothetical protein VNL91_09270 [Thermoanaerobaculia bacterium]|nr:hypothetical protein [Thermoanaerobaculia bacterium]